MFHSGFAQRSPRGRRLMMVIGGVICVAAFSAVTFAGRPSAAGATGCTGVDVAPSADLTAAVSAQGENTTFCLQPGVYHITSVVKPRNGDSLIGQPGTVVDGSKPVSTWAQQGSVWVSTGQTWGPTENMAGWGSIAMEYPQAQYADDLFLDNQGLWKTGVKVNGKVIGSPASAVGPGDYFIDYDANTVYLGSDPTGHQVDVASSLGGIASTATSVTVSGIEVRKTAGSGIVSLGNGWVISGNDTWGNHVAGITGNFGAQVLNNHSHHNGEYGINGRGDHIVVSGNEVDHNDIAEFGSAEGGCSGAGGSKWVNASYLTVTDNNYHDNLCTGIWLDILDNYVVIRNNITERNDGDGIRVEISYNVRIRGNTSRDNTRGGIVVLNTPNVRVGYNTVSGNANEITLGNTGRTDSPSALGPHELRNAYVHHNTVTLGVDEVTGLREAENPMKMGVFTSWGNRFVANHYTIPSTTARMFLWNGTRVNWTQWIGAGNDPTGAATIAS
jgi:parallel beta-helix repeat protein